MSTRTKAGVLGGFSLLLAARASVAQPARPGDAAAPQRPAGPSRSQQLMADTDPKLAELTDRVLFGDVWERPELSKRDRSLVTVATLIALNRPDQLRPHLARALDNGVTRQELTEVVTHLAFYAGWPSAVSAVPILRDVLASR